MKQRHLPDFDGDFPAMSSLLQLWGFRVQMMLQLASFLLLETWFISIDQG
jgi:hypothetical protein